MVVLMRTRLFWRRSAAAAGIYASVAVGFFGTVIVAHAFTTRVLGFWGIGGLIELAIAGAIIGAIYKPSSHTTT